MSPTKISESGLKDVRDLVEAKVKAYDPNAADEEEYEFKGESIPWTRLFTPYASCGDYCLFFTSLLLSSLMGAALPSFCLFFGEAIDSMSSADIDYQALLEPALQEWMTVNGVT